MDEKNQPMTYSHGAPVPNDQNSITTGEKVGYTLLADNLLTEKLAHFTRERVPERVVHAKGSGAHGYFEVTNDLSKYTCAKFLREKGKRTPVFLRFSTVGGEQGSADTARDPRGFALKFYTEDGNYDMVGNDIPIFFVRDAMKFPDFIHTQKRAAQSGLKSQTIFWDFLSLTPESVHQASFLFTDRGTPNGYRHMHGYSSHTYMLYDEAGNYHWFKWHFKTNQGIKNFTAAEAEQMAGKNPDHDRADLFSAIESGNPPSWTAYVQIMTPDEAAKYRFDPFDVTKVWFHGDFPLIEVGKLVLDKNPQNFFAEVEQAAFSPSTLVPGIYISPDKLLNGRMFAYVDAQRYRIGVNKHQIPVNAPRAGHFTNQRDGHMVTDGNYGPEANYYPNSLNGHGEADAPQPPKLALPEAVAARHRIGIVDDDFFQLGDFWRRVMSEEDRAHLVSNLQGHLGLAEERVRSRQCALFYKADADYGAQVAKAVSLDVDQVAKLAAMTPEARAAATAAV